MSSSNLNRSDRLLLDNQVRQLDAMSRSILEMRSTIVRRIRRMDNQRIPVVPPPAPRIHRQRRRVEEENTVGVSNLIQDFDAVANEGEIHYTGNTVTIRCLRPRITLPKQVSKVLKHLALEKTLEEICGICLEMHFKKDSVVCNCSHEFGKICFAEWARIRTQERKQVLCPICRQEVKKVIGFVSSK